MGALHKGHESLIKKSVRESKKTLVSIFVNPKQFAPGEDLATYPRSLDRDLEMIAADGATAALVPSEDLMYPPDEPVWSPPLPSVASNPKLEDLHRPHFFSGVCTVVARLFDLIQPSTAILGEKDWQQLALIRTMTRDLDLVQPPAEAVIGVATVRESDGLAMSSRNRYLSREDRTKAGNLPRLMKQAIAAIEADRLLPDMMSYDPSKPAGYPNGRTFTDHVVAHRLAFISKGEIPPDGLEPHTDTLKDFPYLGTPHPQKSK